LVSVLRQRYCKDGAAAAAICYLHYLSVVGVALSLILWASAAYLCSPLHVSAIATVVQVMAVDPEAVLSLQLYVCHFTHRSGIVAPGICRNALAEA
jgi:hypothetical protein